MPAPRAGDAANADLAAWIAVAAGAIGAFMATLDIAIVNTALPTIVGELGASTREGTWIATSYLVAEVVAIALCGWLERVFGLRRFLLLCVSLFTVFSVICGLADNLATMIVGRVGQGFFGGAMIPTALTIVARQLPLHQRALGTAIFGGTVILGPVLGPLAGGWITDDYGWRNTFLINVPVGLALIAMIAFGVRGEPSQWRALRDADWLGVIGMSMGLGALTALLEQGHAEDWFGSMLIWRLLVVSVVGFGLMAIGQIRAPVPVIDLRLLRNRQFGAVFAISFMLGAALYGTAFMIPQFLTLVAGNTAMQSGVVVFIAGIPAVVLIPFVPLLLRHFDLRLGIALGLAAMALTCWIDTGLSSASGGEAFTLSQLSRGVGQVLAMTFLNQAAMNAVSTAQAADASGLFNAARNLGGSVGLAVLATLHDERSAAHHQVIASAVDPQGGAHQVAASAFDPATVLAAVNDAIAREALVLAFNDQFMALAVGIVCMVPLVLLLRRGTGTASAPVH